MRLRDLQDKLPWRSKYSDEFERGPAHRHFGHALHHVAKALGKLVELQDDLDHQGPFTDQADAIAARAAHAKHVADLAILAVRLANEFPGGKLDLEAAVRERVEEKNGVTLDDVLPLDIEAVIAELQRINAEKKTLRCFRKDIITEEEAMNVLAAHLQTWAQRRGGDR